MNMPTSIIKQVKVEESTSRLMEEILKRSPRSSIGRNSPTAKSSSKNKVGMATPKGVDNFSQISKIIPNHHQQSMTVISNNSLIDNLWLGLKAKEHYKGT